MKTINPNRRDFLKLASMGCTIPLIKQLEAEKKYYVKPPAKTVIQIWMWGGQTHLDVWDPKPDAGYDYCGPLTKPIETNVKGIRIGELLPNLAKCADKYSIIRSMTHGNNSHETAAFMVQTGHMPGGKSFPCIGAISAYNSFKNGYSKPIYPYIVLTKPQGRFGEAGFLGQKYKPFATGGDPANDIFAVEGIVSTTISEERMRNRKKLLEDTNPKTFMTVDMKENIEEMEKKAWDLIIGEEGKVFDLRQEEQETKNRYGKNTFGQSCLVARRLVEYGVPYITINYPGWDTHKTHFNLMRTQLPQMDAGISALINDLSERGLLDSTIIWVGGEFGRTPKIDWTAPWNGGRSHFGKCFSHMICGGGFKGGVVIGESDATGEEVRNRPVYPWDLIGSLYERMGISVDTKLQTPQGELIPLLANEGLPSGGVLKEIV